MKAAVPIRLFGFLCVLSVFWGIVHRIFVSPRTYSGAYLKKENWDLGTCSDLGITKEERDLQETNRSPDFEKEKGDLEGTYPGVEVRREGKNPESKTRLPPCPKWPPMLVGAFEPQMTEQDPGVLEEKYSFLKPGGDYQPPNCEPKDRTAVIIPCTNRWPHLRILLNTLIPFLVRQQASFTIFVVEMVKFVTYNKALTVNAAILEALKRDNYTCFVFHDVDLLPLNDENLYRCGPNPRHLTVAIDKYKYRLIYNESIGGGSVLSRDQLFAINGYSNLYFGWGREDDDFYDRLKSLHMTVDRYPEQIARYKMIRHRRDKQNKENPLRMKLFMTAAKRTAVDGLNTVQSLYKLQGIELRPLYTWIKVSVNMTDVLVKSPPIVRHLFDDLIHKLTVP